MKFTKTAFSNHNACFVCRHKREAKRLIKVNQKAIIETYKKYRIFIKHHARCCKIHFDNSGLLKDSCIDKMPYKLIKQPAHHLMMLDLFTSQQEMVFDAFKDIYTLDESFCLKITGWSKKDFLRFCCFITSLNNSDGRTKEQIIALYRYWLRKGIDQTTLSMMFSNNTSQNKISHYLAQARVSINKDFVPHFLGSKNGKAFFVAHNTATVIELHEVKNDELAIVVDGTYCRCEKSANNQFQYDTYSDQKKDSLLKPFIVCCADGWIIDCYGPFKANNNDAKIFDYILTNDMDFSNIVEKDKTLVLLDRGFRDIYKKLTEEYKFNAKIPTCKQLENDFDSQKEEIKQLTVKQTTESRLVTKCRYIIERVNGMLKNFKTLDNIRNTQIGHIQIDYRIACAMLNFTHIPCVSDGKYTQKVAEKMKQRAKIKENRLDFLLSKQLNTKLIKAVELKKIVDFPKISAETLKNDIFFGSFQLKLAESYYEDIITNNKVYIVSLDLLKKKEKIDIEAEFPDSKILAVDIPSRHRRSEKTKLSKKDIKNNDPSNYKNSYKVFIHYLEKGTGQESILGYVCNCMSGRKILGSCVHVATVICYFGFVKYDEIKLKGQMLKHIFINMKVGQKPNQPKYVRNKRGKRGIMPQSGIKNENVSAKKLKKSSEDLIDQSNCFENKSYTLQNFKNHVPKWGAFIEIGGEKDIFVENTCTIDYFLLSLWCLSKINQNFLEKLADFEEKNILRQIVNKIEYLRWDDARELWVDRIMKIKKNPNSKTISVFGSESEKFCRFLSCFQKFRLLKKCSENCKNNRILSKDDRDIIFFNKIEAKVEIDLSSNREKNCELCKEEVIFEIQFNGNPYFLLIQSRFMNIFVKDIPKIITIDKKKFRFLNATIHLNRHFKSIFEVENNLFLVDDIGQKVDDLKEIGIRMQKSAGVDYLNYPTSTSFYFLE